MPSSKQTQTLSFIRAIAIIFWMTVVIALYFWAYKPFNATLARAVGGALVDLVTMGVLVAVAGGLGRWLLGRLDVSPWSRAERVAAAGLIGLSTLSLLILGVGGIALTPLAMGALLVVIAVATLRDLGGWLANTARWLHTARQPLATRGEQFLRVTIALAVLLALALAVLPPSKWDVLTYHLAGPEQYVMRGQLYAVPHNHYLGFPQQVESLFSGQLALTGRLTGSALMHWAVGALMLLMVGGYTARKTNPAAGLAAVGAVLLGKSIWLEMTMAYVDLLPMGLAMVGLAVADLWTAVRHAAHDDAPPGWWAQHVRPGLGYLVLLGVVVGFAMGTKYSVLWMGVAFGVLVLWLSWRDNWRAAIVFGAIYTLAAAAVMAPWLVRNAVWYDNPVYPFMFEAAEMDTIRQEWYQQPESGMIYSDDAWQLPIMPIMATIFGLEGKSGYSTSIGPLYLILTPMILATWRHLTHDERRTVVRALIFAAVITGFWIFSAAFISHVNQQTRLVLYMFPPLAVVAGIALESLRRLPNKPLDVGFVVRALVLLTLVLTLVDYVRYAYSGGLFTYFSGNDNYAERYREDALGWHYEAMRQVNDLPAGSQVWFLWEPRYLYCDMDRVTCRPDSLLDAWYYARHTAGDPASIAQTWYATGTDYFLVYEFGRTFEKDINDLYIPADWDTWHTFVDRYFVAEWTGQLDDNEDPFYVIYRWRADAVPEAGD
jgi:hypothetical protein